MNTFGVMLPLVHWFHDNQGLGGDGYNCGLHPCHLNSKHGIIPMVNVREPLAVETGIVTMNRIGRRQSRAVEFG